MAWLSETPSCVLSTLIRMIPRIEAYESQARSQEVAVGHGIQPGTWIRKQQREWRQTADGGESRTNKAPSRADLSAVGIGMRKVKRG
jgi:hypothetical protein